MQQAKGIIVLRRRQHEGRVIVRLTSMVDGALDSDFQVAPAIQYSVLSPVRESYFRWTELTIDSSRHAGSEGCAPTPSQYFARAISILISLNGLPSPCGAGFGIGS